MVQQQILDAILATMDQRHVSQGDLAAALGCSQTTVSRLLRGHTQLSVDDLFKIAKVLQVSPSTFIDQAMNKGPYIVTLPADVQQIFCADAVGFQLFSRLKIPTTLPGLAEFFTSDQMNQVRKKIADLKKLGVIIEDIDGKLRLNYPDAEAIYLAQDEHYNARITELYGRLRDTKGDISKLSEKESEAWKKINGDAVVVDYFTRPQIEEQKVLLLQFFNFIRAQLRANRTSVGKGVETQLRAIYLSSLPYPTLKPLPLARGN